MEKSLVLSVSISARLGCYRHIQISEDETLYRLSEAILDSFDFSDDHLHAFYMDNRSYDSYERYVSPYCDSDYARGFSDKVKLSNFRLGKGYKFLYIFDFGDNWRFHIRVLRIVDEPTKSPLVLKSVGEISQYGDDEDDWDNEDGDDGV